MVQCVLLMIPSLESSAGRKDAQHGSNHGEGLAPFCTHGVQQIAVLCRDGQLCPMEILRMLRAELWEYSDPKPNAFL